MVCAIVVLEEAMHMACQSFVTTAQGELDAFIWSNTIVVGTTLNIYLPLVLFIPVNGSLTFKGAKPSHLSIVHC